MPSALSQKGDSSALTKFLLAQPLGHSEVKSKGLLQLFLTLKWPTTCMAVSGSRSMWTSHSPSAPFTLLVSLLFTQPPQTAEQLKEVPVVLLCGQRPSKEKAPYNRELRLNQIDSLF